MTNEYARLLEATERHLQSLKANGVRFLIVENETLRQLRQPPPPKPALCSVEAEPRSSAPSTPSTLSDSSDPSDPSDPSDLSDSSSPSNPESAMAALRARAALCVKCPHLAGSRKNVVFGVGDIHASLMFVGEAPGADEDRQGEPFVGAAGQLLTRIIKTMGFTRETVYIANILKCRPDTPGKSSGNRKPTAEEMKTCLPYLLEQIDLIQPKVIVALGATAVEGLMGKPEPIGKLRGHFQMFRGIRVMPTFHPSYLLRNQALAEKRKVWEDMLQVMEKLNLPVTAKQRGYFLKA
ncbi:MAG: uracil-DNA glycosylase [Verrucomicrobiota bacterium]